MVDNFDLLSRDLVLGPQFPEFDKKSVSPARLRDEVLTAIWRNDEIEWENVDPEIFALGENAAVLRATELEGVDVSHVNLFRIMYPTGTELQTFPLPPRVLNKNSHTLPIVVKIHPSASTVDMYLQSNPFTFDIFQHQQMVEKMSDDDIRTMAVLYFRSTVDHIRDSGRLPQAHLQDPISGRGWTFGRSSTGLLVGVPTSPFTQDPGTNAMRMNKEAYREYLRRLFYMVNGTGKSLGLTSQADQFIGHFESFPSAVEIAFQLASKQYSRPG